MPEPLPLIAVLATGGTIAGRSNGPDGGYASGVVPVDELLASAPGIAAIARLRPRQVAAIGSEHMTEDVWLRLAEAVAAELAAPEISGAVILHGTDTMEETACFLDLVLSSDKPAAITGAMRPPDHPGADGPANLLDAVRLAASPAASGLGVLLTLNGDIHAARDAVKTDALALTSFQSPGAGPLGRMAAEGPVIQRIPRILRPPGGFKLDSVSSLPRVEIIYGHAGQRRDLVDAAVAAGTAGLIHAGVGMGMIHQNIRPALLEATAAGVAVVCASRVWHGPVAELPAPRDAEADRRLIPSGPLNPQKARVLLQLALTRTRDPKAIRAMFETYGN